MRMKDIYELHAVLKRIKTELANASERIPETTKHLPQYVKVQIKRASDDVNSIQNTIKLICDTYESKMRRK